MWKKCALIVTRTMNAFIASVFSVIVVSTFAADRNMWLESRTKFIIYNQKYVQLAQSACTP